LITDVISPAYPGKYALTFTDANGCIASNSVRFNLAHGPELFTPIEVDSMNGYNISCKGASDGSATAGATPFNVNLTFNLFDTDTLLLASDFIYNTSDITWESLAPGTYLVNVIDAAGCSDWEPFTLIEPPQTLSILSSSLSYFHSGLWNVECNGSDNGFIHLDNIQGGRPSAYDFTWEKNNLPYSEGDGIRNLGNLGFGNYAVTVTDGYCYDSADFTLTAPPLIEFTDTIVTENRCYGDATGSIEVVVQGGVGDYTYTWSHDPLLNQPLADNLTAGIYSVIVSDSINCEINDTINLIPPVPLAIAADTSNYNGFEIGCYNGTDGYIHITATGGKPVLQYNWTGGLPPNPLQDNLAAGIYIVTVTDANSCSLADTFNLISPEQLAVTFTIADKLCNTYGSIISFATGGVNPYTYSWSNAEITPDIHNLSPDSYILTLTDLNSCQLIDTAIVGEQSDMNINILIENPISCYGYSDGKLSAEITGSHNPPFTIIWDNSVNSETLENVSMGIHRVDITDLNECHDTASRFIDEPKIIKPKFEVFEPSCYDSSDARIDFDATGGNGNYSFTLDEQPVNNYTADTLHAEKDYHILITDNKNCQADTTFKISQPDALNLIEETLERVPPSCPDALDGKLVVKAEGGTPDYIFTWLDSQTVNAELSGIDQDWYKVRVVDNNGCFTESKIYLKADLPACLEVPSAFSPNSDGVNDFWDIVNPLNEDMDLTLIYPEMVVKVFNRWGQEVWESQKGYPKSSAWTGNDSNGRSLPVDSYHYIIDLHHESGVTLTGIVTIVK
jgi:large repetitive protein